METVKSRSESPFSRSKAKNQRSGTPENGDTAPEQVKPKRKRHTKQKLNGKENGEPEKNGNDYGEEEKVTSLQIDSIEENGNAENDNCNNGYDVNNGNKEEAMKKDENEENEVLINPCETVEEEVVNTEGNDNVQNSSPEKCTSSEEPSSNMTIETESSAKKDILEQDDVSNGFEAKNENGEENHTEESNDTAESFTQNGETVENGLRTESTSQTEVNGSDESLHQEDTHIRDVIQASPDAGLKEENSFSNKISNFLGKWNNSSSQEEKQDTSEISSSKNLNDSIRSEGPILSHPYLSKVSGRRGIRDRLNSSASFTSSKDEEMKTPTNSGNPLNDSFRVRTNPPRLNSSEIQENPTLRKYKGKRCLNANDDPDDCLGAIKRQKMDESNETGLLGAILWSPFKKKSLESEKMLKSTTTTESKLSRFLSPFWFWKKTAGSQERK